jgi:hypothetical protein
MEEAHTQQDCLLGTHEFKQSVKMGKEVTSVLGNSGELLA